MKADTVGTHSIRSIFAMILLFDNIRLTTIKKLGCWLSDVIICYIRENVLDFSKGMSKAFNRNDQ